MKQPGEAVAADEPLVELETDKVTVEVNAPAAGVLTAISVPEGAEVEVGALLGMLDGADRRRRRSTAAAAPAHRARRRSRRRRAPIRPPGVNPPPRPPGPVARPARRRPRRRRPRRCPPPPR